jgi:hypothetical protein
MLAQKCEFVTMPLKKYVCLDRGSKDFKSQILYKRYNSFGVDDNAVFKTIDIFFWNGSVCGINTNHCDCWKKLSAVWIDDYSRIFFSIENFISTEHCIELKVDLVRCNLENSISDLPSEMAHFINEMGVL